MIEIPKSNAREQQENELASWVLEKLKTRNEVQILQRTEGCCAGNWVGSLPDENGTYRLLKRWKTLYERFADKGTLLPSIARCVTQVLI